MKSEPKPLRVLCIDDNRMLTDSLCRRIAREQDLEWVGAVHDGAAMRSVAVEMKPDVILMDIDMPEVDTFAMVERLAVDVPGARVIMFSGHVSPAYIARSIDCGAWGYLSKNDDVSALIDGIRQVGDRKSVV